MRWPFRAPLSNYRTWSLLPHKVRARGGPELFLKKVFTICRFAEPQEMQPDLGVHTIGYPLQHRTRRARPTVYRRATPGAVRLGINIEECWAA